MTDLEYEDAASSDGEEECWPDDRSDTATESRADDAGELGDEAVRELGDEAMRETSSGTQAAGDVASATAAGTAPQPPHATELALRAAQIELVQLTRQLGRVTRPLSECCCQ